MIELEFVKYTDPRYADVRPDHYPALLDDRLDEEAKVEPRKKQSQGQALHFVILVDGQAAGITSGGAAVYSVKGRDEFFGVPKIATPGTEENWRRSDYIQSICNNTQFDLLPGSGARASEVIALWRRTCEQLWPLIYGVRLIGFETFVWGVNLTTGLERDGYIYMRDRWTGMKGQTVGLTKEHREGGLTKSWTEQRTPRRKTPPKRMFYRWASLEVRELVKAGVLPERYEGTWDANKRDSETGEYVNPPEIRQKKLAKAKERKSLRDQFLGVRFS